MAKDKKQYQNSLRNSTEYNILLHHFDDAVEKIWPTAAAQDIYQIEGTCVLNQPLREDIERIIITSYRLMKHIRQILAKKKLPYKQGMKYPSLYTALEHAVAYTIRGKDSLATEADKLEAVSRAGYKWLKMMKRLGRPPLRSDFEPREPTWDEWEKNRIRQQQKYCFVCKTRPTTDSADQLCDYCNGAAERNMVSPSAWAASIVGKCGTCKMPCKADEYYCDLCRAESAPISGHARAREMAADVGKQTSIIIQRDGGPFDHIDRRYPTSKLQDWGDMMMPNRRMPPV